MSDTENPNQPDMEGADTEAQAEGVESNAESRRAFIKKLAYIPPAMQTFILVDSSFAGDDDDDDDDDGSTGGGRTSPTPGSRGPVIKPPKKKRDKKKSDKDD